MTTPPELLGTYTPPQVKSRQRVWCEYRGQWCRITTWTEGRIPWPRCAPIGVMGGSGLWINEELQRAILTESAEALKYWFGVGPNAVWRWRRAFDVSHTGTPGSKQAHQAASQQGAEAIKSKEWTKAELAKKRRISKRLKLRPGDRWAESGWKPEELVLLGTMPDKELAVKLGRTWASVRAARLRKGIPSLKK